MLIILFIFIILLLLNNKTNCKLIESFNTNINKYKQYLINLDHRSDRFNVTNNLLSIFNFKHIIRYPAINGKNMLYNELVNIVDPDAMTSILNNFRKEHHELSYGAVGCYLSHVNIWDELSKLYDTNEIIIFEDDIIFKENVLSEIKRYLSIAPKDWDIIQLSTLRNINYNVVGEFYKPSGFWGMQSYILNKRGAKKLIKEVEKYKIDGQIDAYLSRMIQRGKITIYIIKQRLFFNNENGMKSDIQCKLIKNSPSDNPFNFKGYIV